MQTEDTSRCASLKISQAGVLFVSGYATSLRVERRQLVVRTGSGRNITEATFAKVTRPRLRRIVIAGTAGHLSLPVLDWVRGVGAVLVVIDRNGEVLASSIEGPKDARLLRAQALAPYNATGVMIARALIGEKLRGQTQVLQSLEGCDDAIKRIAHEARLIQGATKVQAIRAAEARAAARYWGCWSARVEIRFARRELTSVPPHWRAFDQRRSSLSGTPRKATDPINALINYAGALAQVECEIACRALGLSPSLAIVHGDVVNRSGFALDLQEVVRPSYEAAVLQLLRSQTFSLRDFGEDPEGRCTLSRRITRYLAESIAVWTRGLAPVAEHVVQVLADSSPLRVGGIPTRLTQAKRRTARAKPESPVREKQVSAAPHRVCEICGAPLRSAVRSYCDNCLRQRKQDLVAEMLNKSITRLAQARDDGRDPAHGEHAATRRGATISRRMVENREWEHAHPEPADPEVFRQEILPGLREIPVRTIARVLGVTTLYAGQIRNGRIPHGRHWSGLRSLFEG